VPAGFLIGGSVSSAGELATVHASDFVTIGPVLGAGDNSLGVAGFQRLAAACGVPAIAVGGVDASVAGAFRSVGASGVAAIRGLFGVTDVEGAARALREAWDASGGAAREPVSAV
jgi:thiamine-phosphate pyrophosphorylase